MKEKEQNNRGITLVSLVITIVIMLILAAVAINLIIGKNGLFNKAKDSATIYENSRNKENEDLAGLEGTLDGLLTLSGKSIEEKENSNEVKISTVDQMKTLITNINNGSSYKDKSIIFESDIDLNKGKYTVNENGTVTFTDDATKYNPIGDEEHPFEGTIDGKGFIIMGLYINNTKNDQGLVGYNKGTIKNIGLKYGSVTANDNVGAFAGTNEGNISNCFNQITITGNKSVGGIVGKSYGDNSLTIMQCANIGRVIGLTKTGGIAGEQYSTNSSASKTIINCYNSGYVRSNDENLNNPITGGIVGLNSSNEHASNYVINCYSSGKVVGNYQTDSGGIVGKNEIGIIGNCFYLENTVNLSNDPDGLNKGVHKTQDELKSEDTYTSWDFDTVWYERENDLPSLVFFKNKI